MLCKLVSCQGNFSTVELRLEALPPVWKDLRGLQYEFVWHDGRQAHRIVQKDRKLSLKLPLIPALPLLVYPVHAAGRLRPAAAFYGPETASVLHARWRDGGAGEIMFGLLQDGKGALRLNIIKLRLAINKMADPWQVDIAKTTEQFLSANRRGSPIRLHSASPLQVDIPDGQWMPANPFALSMSSTSAISATSATKIVQYHVYEGEHLYIEQGGQRKLILSVHEGKQKLWLGTIKTEK